MRSGWRSALVPCSACAVSAADVRLKNSGSPAPTPMPYRPRARKSRREHEQRRILILPLINADQTQRTQRTQKKNLGLLSFVSFVSFVLIQRRNTKSKTDLSELVLRHAEHEIQQFSKRR